MAAEKKAYQGKQPTPVEINRVEAYLTQTLRPVKPREDFVASLRAKIIQQPLPQTRPISAWESALFIAAGILSGVLIVIASIRAAMTLLTTLKILKQPRSSLRG